MPWSPQLPSVWLELSYHDGTSLITLSPRTKLLMVPYAAKSDAAERLVVPNSFDTALKVNGSGYVGIGTDNPATGLHISGDGADGVAKFTKGTKSVKINPKVGPANYAFIGGESGDGLDINAG